MVEHAVHEQPQQVDAQHHMRRLVAEYLNTLAAAEQEQPADATPEQQPNEGNATTNNNSVAMQDQKQDDMVRVDGCASDLATYCKPESNILTLLENAPMDMDPASVSRAMKNVQLCMAKNVESLSPACIEVLVANIVDQKSNARTTDETVANPLPPSFASENNSPRAGDDEDSSMEVSIHYSKHHNTGLRGHPAAIASAPAIDQAKQSATLSSASDMDIGSPLMWFLVLPFFCIGLYTSYNHVLVYLRRRREVFRVESKQYMPVP